MRTSIVATRLLRNQHATPLPGLSENWESDYSDRKSSQDLANCSLEAGCSVCGGNQAGTVLPDPKRGPATGLAGLYRLPFCVLVIAVLFDGLSRHIFSFCVRLVSLAACLELARLSGRDAAGRTADGQELFLC